MYPLSQFKKTLIKGIKTQTNIPLPCPVSMNVCEKTPWDTFAYSWEEPKKFIFPVLNKFQAEMIRYDKFYHIIKDYSCLYIHLTQTRETRKIMLQLIKKTASSICSTQKSVSNPMRCIHSFSNILRDLLWILEFKLIQLQVQELLIKPANQILLLSQLMYEEHIWFFDQITRRTIQSADLLDCFDEKLI